MARTLVIANQHGPNLIIRKKPYKLIVMHKCDSVQFLFRQHESLFAASREFRGGLMACLFLGRFSASRKNFRRLHAYFRRNSARRLLATAWGGVYCSSG